MNATAMKPKLGDQRYIVVWCDKADLLLDARSHGWTERSETGPLDYTEAANHDRARPAGDFDNAVEKARKLVAADFWGCPRVYLQEFGPADVPAGAREWEDVKLWDIEVDGTATEQSA